MIRIQAPDGTVVEFPAGTPDDTIIRVMRQNFPARPAEAPADRSVLESAARTVGQFGAGFNERLAQTVGALPDLYNRGLRAVGAPAMPEGFYTQGIQRGINAAVGEPPAPEGAIERGARGAGQGLVDAATVMVPAGRVAAATAPAAGAAPNLAHRIATALSAQPVMQTAAGMTGGAVGEATDNPLLGMTAAFAVPTVAATAGRLISPVRHQNSPGRQNLVDAARREGIRLTAGQETGSRFLQNVEQRLEQLPLTSAAQRAIRERAEEDFTRAAMRRTGTSTDNVTPETLNAARDRIGQVIGTLSQRNNLVVTPDLRQSLDDVESGLRFLPGGIQSAVRERINQIRGSFSSGPNGQTIIPGRAYRLMDSELGRAARGTGDGDLRGALSDIRERMRAAMDASISPQDAADWAQARRDYANLMVIARAAGGAGATAAEGRLSPLALRGALDQSTGRGYAFGRGDLNELARVGQALLRPPPDSGTAGATLANNLLTGSALASGGAGVGAMWGGPAGAAVGAGASLLLPRIVQGLMNTDAGQAYLRNQAVRNPAFTRNLAAALAAQQGAAQAVEPRAQ
jgi:hypothetical protein